MTEKLTMEDAYVMELVVNKINEVIDRLDTMEDDYDRRISAHWKFHRKEQEEKAGAAPKPKGKKAEWKKQPEASDEEKFKDVQTVAKVLKITEEK